ncbi:MAG: hypothetical protein AABZ14_02940, partial [Candidatus Margulisiibacteriota bacterium]
KMGTSGTRLKATEFDRKNFLLKETQAVCRYWLEMDEASRQKGHNRIIIGGDPRNGNPERIKEVARIVAANGFEVIVADNKGLATTPAMSAAIMKHEALGAIILTASHNPAEDVGLKVNQPFFRGAGPVLEDATDRIYELMNSATFANTLNISYEEALEKKLISEANLVAMNTEFYNEIFDVELLKNGFNGKPFSLIADPMHGATGPYLQSIAEAFGIQLKMINAAPDPYFGPKDEHRHPEPEPRYLNELITLSHQYDLASGYDADGDRNLHFFQGMNITAGDLGALLAEYHHFLPIKHDIFNDGCVLIGRSIVSSSQADRVVLRKQREGEDIKMIQTPTGFKWISELGNVGFEESNGLGNPYHGEKDGLFATMFLFTIMAKTQKTIHELLEEMYKKDGRVYFTRGGVTCPKKETSDRIMTYINPSSRPKKISGLELTNAFVFDYKSPVSGIESKNQAYVFNLMTPEGQKLILSMRFSGTGTGDPMLRVYCDYWNPEYNLRLNEALNFIRPIVKDIVGKEVEMPELDYYATAPQ